MIKVMHYVNPPWLLSHGRSPPRPNPAGLRYSDEDICNNYNGAVSTESTALTERPAEMSESEVESWLGPTYKHKYSLLLLGLCVLHPRQHSVKSNVAHIDCKPAKKVLKKYSP